MRTSYTTPPSSPAFPPPFLFLECGRKGPTPPPLLGESMGTLPQSFLFDRSRTVEVAPLSSPPALGRIDFFDRERGSSFFSGHGTGGLPFLQVPPSPCVLPPPYYPKAPYLNPVRIVPGSEVRDFPFPSLFAKKNRGSDPLPGKRKKPFLLLPLLPMSWGRSSGGIPFLS